MSQGLAPFDVTGLAVGQSDSIDLTQVMAIGGMNPDKKPTVRIHNDSGSGLYVVLPSSSQSFNLPAGGWQDCMLQPSETAINFTVLYLLPDPPVNLIMVTFYGPNEDVPPMTILGNSPVGIGGTINTSNTSIVNDGNPPGTSIIESTPVDAASSTWKADNSGNLTIKSDNAGTLTTLIQLIAGASPAVKLAAAAVLVEALGNLQVDGVLIVNGINDSSGDGIIAVTGSSGTQNTRIQSGGIISMQIPGGATTWEFTGADFNNIGGGTIHLNVGQLKDINSGTVSVVSGGTVVVNHGLSGTPAAVLAVTDQASSSGTCSCHTYTSTQFSLFNGGGATLTYRWFAYR